MGKRFKIIRNIFLWTIAPILILYCAIYFALPYFANKNDYSKKITEAIKNETSLIFLVDNYKVEISPALNLTIKANEIQGYYPNKTPFIVLKNPNINISTLNLIKKELKINKIKASEVQFSTKLLKSGKTTIQEYLEKNIKPNNVDLKISSKSPQIDIEQYVFKLKDEESGQKFKIKGTTLKSSQSLEFNYINFETNGEFYCFNKKYTKYKIKASIPKALFNNINKKMFDISADDLYKYNFYADLNTDIKIYEKNGKFDTFSGKIDIDKFSITLDSIKLPQSYFHIISDKKKATITSKLYTGQNEFTDILASLKIQKPYTINIKCNCENAKIDNLQKITESICKILKIKNSLKDFNTSGTVKARFDIDTDFKTIKSNGLIKIEKGKISHNSIPLSITDINSIIDFSGNKIEIINTHALANNQPIKISGNIDSNAIGNITIKANNLDIKNTIKAISVVKIPANIIIKNGKLSFETNIQGKLLEAKPHVISNINNLSLVDKTNNIAINSENTNLDLIINNKNYSGKVVLEGLSCNNITTTNSLNTIKSKLIELNISNDEIKIKPSKLNAGKANLILSGTIKNYIKQPDINLNTSGTIDAKFIKTFIPNLTELYASGYIPIKIALKGKQDNAKFNIKALANNNNYITPILIKNTSNTLTSINGVISNNYIQIDDVSIYIAKNINSLVEEINTTKLEKILNIKGKIKNYLATPKFENISIIIPKIVQIQLPETNNGIANVIGNITLNGDTNNPNLNGVLSIKDIDVPEYKLHSPNAMITFSKSNAIIQVDELSLDNTLLGLIAEIENNILQTKKIKNLKINAQTLNMNTINKILTLLPTTNYGPGVIAPYEITKGTINIKNFIIEPITVNNITGDIYTEKNNYFIIKNLYGNAYGGNFAGKVEYNLPYLTTNANIQGRGINAESITLALLPKEQKISGKLDFDANIDLMGITPEQQLKTAKGAINLLINNGHLGQLGRFEHFLYAQNLISQKLINASLNSAKQAIAPKDTGYFTYLKGTIELTNGIATLKPISTAGPHMSMYIKGKMDLMNNYTDLEILGKVSSEVSSSMGLFGSMTIKDFLEEHTKYGENISKIFKDYNKELPEVDISKIPSLTPDYKYKTKNFKVSIIGDPNSVKSVKSFSWVNPIGTAKQLVQEEYNEQAKESIKINSYEENSQTNNLKTKQSSVQVSQPNFLENIPDYFHD